MFLAQSLRRGVPVISSEQKMISASLGAQGLKTLFNCEAHEANKVFLSKS
jgi:hypothetical protein